MIIRKWDTGMNKIAHYLNTHMLGEVIVSPAVLAAYSTDGSVLQYTPDMVAYPRATSDVRKIARFSWQLAEKGHTLPLTVRGAGTDTTGAAIGSGMIVGTMAHMNRIFEYDGGQKLVRLQPGVTVNSLTNALSLHGTAIPELRWDHQLASIGGSIASQRSAIEYVEQLEVVLANGDVLQTKRLSKRELDKKKGEQTFEGEIYRKVDGLILDSADLLDQMVHNDDRLDHEGYAGLEMVKQKNGSMDLTPLFVGSQGSLGIISEMILKADFVNQSPSVVVATFAERSSARDALDVIDDIDPSSVEYVDGKYFEAARMAGKTYQFYDEAKEQFGSVAAVVIVTINDFNERTRHKKTKRLLAKLKPHGAHVVSDNDFLNSDLRSLGSITYWLLNPENSDLASPPVLDGMFIPLERFDVFADDLDALMKHHHVALALYGRPQDELWYVRPLLRMVTVADKQKLFKLTSALAALAEKHGGSAFGASGDGRIGAGLRIELTTEHELFKKLKDIFDPNGTLNPGVKHDTNIRDLARQLRSSYDGPVATSYLAKF
ncbi:FAD-binding oxidoreductase [Candidatus Saccharibacteria bacterium]|nr:FAD-binding oxidoreductase [Candidatus Saccharibacteria bacterium]